jgi:hypothetical protein
LPFSEAIPSYKTNDEGVDGHDIDGGPMREVELHVSFLAASFLHPQQLLVETATIGIRTLVDLSV